MAAAPTNGTGRDDELAPSRPVPSDPDLDVLRRGSTLGRYLVLERLGAGAMGVVYAAYDPELDRKVAIKILRPHGGGDQERRRARLVREAKAIAKVSHPNVVGIFDVGVHDGQVFMAMEHLAGGTLRDWVEAKKRTWSEIVRMFAEVGSGLAGAHAEGLIHRDFKPDNVLLDKAHKPKVVDFGLVRLNLDTTTSSTDQDDPAFSETVIPPSGGENVGVLTRTGALTGTPAYMAPEQFLGRSADARSDQFAFCVALYEALYGERPFAGDTVVALADNVTMGTVRDAPRDASVPGWIRAVVLRGMRRLPAERYAGMTELLAALADDPAIRLRKRVATAGVAAAALVAVIAVRQSVRARRAEFEQRIAQRLAEATTLEAQGRAIAARLAKTRTNALEAYDHMRVSEGESLWKEVLLQQGALAELQQRAAFALEAASSLDPDRREVKQRLAELSLRQALLAEERNDAGEVADKAARMKALDPSGETVRAWTRPAELVVTSAPAHAHLVLERFEATSTGARRAVALSQPAIEVGAAVSLPPGSYRLGVTAPSLAPVAYPFLLRRGERLTIAAVPPAAEDVPEGFVYVPEGRFLFGEADEKMRTGFIHTVPLHDAATQAFLIARHETTFREWIAFLESMPAAAAEKVTPRAATAGLRGAVSLSRRDGRWEIMLKPVSVALDGKAGEKLTYPERHLRQQQDWLAMPVVGVSRQDIERYIGWKRSTGAVPGARLCTELEWERAARGADDRVYPHGNQLRGDEANIDETYGHAPGGYGLDEVGSHPQSDSPFGVEDMAGNAFEIVDSSLAQPETVARGGAYYYFKDTERSTNREVVEPTLRNHMVGFRLCADIKERR